MKRLYKWLLPSLIILTLIGTLLIRIHPPKDDKVPRTANRNLLSALTTDRAQYKPGQPVIFSLRTNEKSVRLNIQYYRLNQAIDQKSFNYARDIP
ncbi:hypothetical protein NIE88_07475 [Sporolactobacillus shoreicorticis]|uniref:Uncharacterized protein n=1 Tax=Sporolactobacillus shoreicorticis TaxID=1923877 RepID=A0ABW5S9U6_9BACL|nr:hypothetical protein [Sporolactobacillus shoreicorticis]MCO7125609.1 hypothetical protein [Sporolactobacillus shoreicorticis]